MDDVTFIVRDSKLADSILLLGWGWGGGGGMEVRRWIYRSEFKQKTYTTLKLCNEEEFMGLILFINFSRS